MNRLPLLIIIVSLSHQGGYMSSSKLEGYLRLKLRVTQISNFVIEYLRENKKVSKTDKACSYTVEYMWPK